MESPRRPIPEMMGAARPTRGRRLLPASILRATLAALCILPALAALGSGGRDPVLSFDVTVLDAAAIEDAVDEGRAVRLDLLGEPRRLFLRRTGLRSPRLVARAGAVGAERPLIPLRARTFAGEVAGKPGSTVRLSATGDGILGYIRQDDGWIFIEPLPPGSPLHQAGAHRVYTEADLDPEFVLPCGATAGAPEANVPDADGTEAGGTEAEGTEAEGTEAEGTEAEGTAGSPAPALRGAAIEDVSTAAEAATLKEIELAVDTDREFVAASLARGADPTQEVEALLNLVDGIYQAELGLKLTLVHLRHWDAEPDPYTSTESQALLVELKDHWNVSRKAVARDAVHLLTGKDLDGSVVGLAYMSVVCNIPWAYGLSQDLPQARALMPLLMAHEIGHNLGAEHDVDTGGARYIMYPSVGPSTLHEFSDPSASQIAATIAGTSCLATVADDGTGGTDPPPDPPPDDGIATPEDGGGGGGGPVDPIVALILAVGAAAHAGRRSGRPRGRGAPPARGGEA